MNSYKKEDYMLFVLLSSGDLCAFHREFVEDHSIRQDSEFVDVMWLVNSTKEEKDVWAMLYPSVDITVIGQQIEMWGRLRANLSQRGYWITTELRYIFNSALTEE